MTEKITKEQVNEAVRELFHCGAKWLPDYGDALGGIDEKAIKFRKYPIVLYLDESRIEINGQSYHMDETTKEIAEKVWKKSNIKTLVILLAIAAGFCILCAVKQSRNANKQESYKETMMKRFDAQRGSVAQFYNNIEKRI